MDEFEKAVLESLNETINEMGTSTKLALLYHLKRRGVALEDVVKEPERFEDAIKEIYGPASEILFSLIFRKLGRKLGIRTEATSGFLQRLQEAREEWMKKKSI